MLAKVLSGALLGIDAYPVVVEVAQGLPQFATVGLPEGAVKESKDRVKSAIKNSGYEFPTRRITINLAPADIRKDGAAFDLPMAIGLLAAMNPCPCGYLGDPQHGCACTPAMLQRYRTRLSGPLLDRIDLQLEVPRTAYRDLSDTHPGEASSMIRSRVERARSISRSA